MRLAALILLVLASTSVAAPPPTTWSTPSEGLRARLIATAATDGNKHAQIELALEIENVSDVDGGIGVPWGDPNTMLKFTLEDEHGKPLENSAIGGSYASGQSYVVLLPVRSSLHYTITTAALEYVSGAKTLFRPLTFQAWDLPATHGKLFVRATLMPAKLDAKTKAPSRAFTKPIELPRIALP